MKENKFWLSVIGLTTVFLIHALYLIEPIIPNNLGLFSLMMGVWVLGCSIIYARVLLEKEVKE